ncbi:hypothetical protein GGX14DRAFT_539809 [Mycena pura]|uniref:Uncharacterized protein n=1 Tax=Mycena pura TaxID=153505 RepID=A0AAD6YQ89_9AGAR|nr:hypothetical protein GGX14DRAFT_539809 [Mycena pura]
MVLLSSREATTNGVPFLQNRHESYRGTGVGLVSDVSRMGLQPSKEALEEYTRELRLYFCYSGRRKPTGRRLAWVCGLSIVALIIGFGPSRRYNTESKSREMLRVNSSDEIQEFKDSNCFVLETYAGTCEQCLLLTRPIDLYRFCDAEARRSWKSPNGRRLTQCSAEQISAYWVCIHIAHWAARIFLVQYFCANRCGGVHASTGDPMEDLPDLLLPYDLYFPEQLSSPSFTSRCRGTTKLHSLPFHLCSRTRLLKRLHVLTLFSPGRPSVIRILRSRYLQSQLRYFECAALAANTSRPAAAEREREREPTPDYHDVDPRLRRADPRENEGADHDLGVLIARVKISNSSPP